MNGGSSSIKFALYQMGDPPQRGLHGKVDRTDEDVIIVKAVFRILADMQTIQPIHPKE